MKACIKVENNFCKTQFNAELSKYLKNAPNIKDGYNWVKKPLHVVCFLARSVWSYVELVKACVKARSKDCMVLMFNNMTKKKT